MKCYFDADGALIVEGEDATEWLALRTWIDTWSAGVVPLWVKMQEYEAAPVDDDCGGWRRLVPSLRQLFRRTEP